MKQGTRQGQKRTTGKNPSATSWFGVLALIIHISLSYCSAFSSWINLMEKTDIKATERQQKNYFLTHKAKSEAALS